MMFNESDFETTCQVTPDKKVNQKLHKSLEKHQYLIFNVFHVAAIARFEQQEKQTLLKSVTSALCLPSLSYSTTCILNHLVSNNALFELHFSPCRSDSR